MNLTEINTWWQRAVKKEELRKTNHPLSLHGNPWMTPTDFKNFAPSPKRNARRRRSA